MKPNNTATTTFQDVFVARQPVFDIRQKVWGYELLYRDGIAAVVADFSDQDAATLSVTDSATLWPFADLPANTRILVNFAEKSIINNVPYALPAKHTVIQIPETCSPDASLLETLRQMQSNGYGLALDDFTGKGCADELFSMADVLIVDLLGLSKEKFAAIHKAARNCNAKLLAKKVETQRAFTLAKNAGFLLFQGYFFKKPEVLPDRKLSASETAKLKLFKIIERPEPDFEALSKTMETDVSVSYRLLRYLNSPFFGMVTKVNSIRQATVLLGWNHVRNFLRVIILTDLKNTRTTSELPFLSTLRGRFFQLLSGCAPCANAESMFLFGLFSLLDSLLQMPMKDIVQMLPLDENLAKALTGENDSLAPWLELAKAYEAGDWPRLDEAIESLNLDPVVVARAYSGATQWANAFFSSNAD